MEVLDMLKKKYPTIERDPEQKGTFNFIVDNHLVTASFGWNNTKKHYIYKIIVFANNKEYRGSGITKKFKMAGFDAILQFLIHQAKREASS